MERQSAALVGRHPSHDRSFEGSVEPSRHRFVVNGTPVFYVVDRDDDVWCMAQPIAEVIGYSRRKDARIADGNLKTYQELRRDCKSCPADELHPLTVFVSQRGLLSVLMASKKPVARRFQEWLTRSFLPAVQVCRNCVRLREMLREREPEMAGDRPQIHLISKNDVEEPYDYYLLCGQARRMAAGLKRLRRQCPRAEVIHEMDNVYNTRLFQKKMQRALTLRSCRGHFNTILSRQDLISKVQALERAVSHERTPMIRATIPLRCANEMDE